MSVFLHDARGRRAFVLCVAYRFGICTLGMLSLCLISSSLWQLMVFGVTGINRGRQGMAGFRMGLGPVRGNWIFARRQRG